MSKILDMLREFPGGIVRKVYFYTCKDCKREKRQSYFKDRANYGVCGTCKRRDRLVADGQMRIEDLDE